MALLAGAVVGALLPGIGATALGLLLLAAAALGAMRRRFGAALLFAAACAVTRLLAASIWQVEVPCDERLMAEARITSIPARTPEGWQFDARVRHPRSGSSRSIDVRLEFPRQDGLRPRAGETWQLMVQYGSQGNGAARSRVMLRDRMHTRARVRASPLNQRLATASLSWVAVRERIALEIGERVADPAAAALIAALAVGATGEVSDRQWRVFSATGISHLVAISGMHVTFFAMLSMWVARRLWAHVPALARTVRRDAFAASVGVVMAAGYALLSGFSVPAQRTLVMLVAFVIVREQARAARPCAALAWATTGVLAWDPLAVLDAGFWLSYVAVAALILMPGARVRERGMIASAVDVQWTVSLALLPLTLVVFGLFSVAGLAVNAVAIPVFTVLLVPAVLVATAGYLLPLELAGRLAGLLVDAAQWIVRPMWVGLAQVADLPGAVVAATPGPLLVLVAAGAVVLVLLPLGAQARCAAALLLAWTFVAAQPVPTRHRLEVEFLDVGGESAVLVRTPAHALLVGTGETFGSRGRRYEAALLPRLRERLGRSPEAWVLGRLNRDRLAALTVATAARPGLSAMAVTTSQRLPPEVAPCHTHAWQWEDVDFAVEALPSGRGCLVEVRVGEQRVLLPLDGTDGDWRSLADGQRLAADLVLLPRRASAWPMNEAPAGQAAGMLAVASVSANEQATPGWRALQAQLQSAGYTVWSTAGEGAVRIVFDGISAPRRIAARPWWARYRSLPGSAVCVAPDQSRPLRL